MQKLIVSLDTMAGELAKEKAGLQKRYEAASTDAAFSMDAIDSGNTAADLSQRVDGLSDALVRYSKRVTELDAQIAFVGDLQQTVQTFLAERGIDASPPG